MDDRPLCAGGGPIWRRQRHENHRDGRPSRDRRRGDRDGVGRLLAARSDAEHYHTERAREETEVREKATVEAEEVADVFRADGLTAEEIQPVVDALRERPEAWVDFMMRFELGLEKPEPRRAMPAR